MQPIKTQTVYVTMCLLIAGYLCAAAILAGWILWSGTMSAINAVTK